MDKAKELQSKTIEYEWIEDVNLLSVGEQNLLQEAFGACDNAYAPFSKFHVGCALEMKGGEIILGNNQENHAFPSGLCAERVALFYAGAQGKTKDIRKIAIRVRSLKKLIDRPATPCGACRQVMLESENLAQTPFIVLMQGEKGPILKLKGVANSLLPFHFDIDLG